MSISVDLLTVARLVSNFAEDATGGGAWSTTQLYRVTVPTGKRWFFVGGNHKRDNASTCEITIRDATNKVIWQIDSYAAATTAAAVPSTTAQVNTFAHTLGPIPMEAGSFVNYSFGVAQGASAYASFNVLEIDI